MLDKEKLVKQMALVYNMDIVLRNHREMARNKVIRAKTEKSRQYWRGYLNAIIRMEKVNPSFRRETEKK